MDYLERERRKGDVYLLVRALINKHCPVMPGVGTPMAEWISKLWLQYEADCRRIDAGDKPALDFAHLPCPDGEIPNTVAAVTQFLKEPSTPFQFPGVSKPFA